MDSKLRQVIENWLIREGDNAKAKLSAASDVSVSTIANLVNGKPISAKKAYQLALACGCRDEEALALSKGRSSEAKTA